MTIRRLHVLIKNLPADCALACGFERIRDRAEEADYRAREARYIAHKQAREVALAAERG